MLPVKPVLSSCVMIPARIRLHVLYVKVTNFPTSYLRTNCCHISLSVNPHYAPLITQLFSVCFTVKGHSCQHTKGQLSSNKREHDYKSYWVECKVEIKQQKVGSLGHTIIFLLKSHGVFIFYVFDIFFIMFFRHFSAGIRLVSHC